MGKSSSRLASNTVDSVCELLLGLDDLHPWVRSILGLFPIPSPPLAQPVFSAMLRIAEAVPWLAEELGYDPKERLLRVVTCLKARGSISRSEAQKRLDGNYSLAGTLVGSEAVPMPGPDAVRAVLWFCAEKWADRGEKRAGSIIDLASALRNAVKIRSREAAKRHPLAKHFSILGSAKSLREFVAISAILKDSEQESLKVAWNQIWLFLDGTQQLKLRTSEPSAAPSQSRTSSRNLDEDLEVEAVIEGVRSIPTQPPLGQDAPESGEPPAEVATTTMVVPIVGSQANPDARRLAKLRARQVVWMQNSLLLTNHPSVLPLDMLRRAIRVLTEEMEAPSDSLRLGVAGLLLQAVTGRTSRSLLAMRIVEQFDAMPKAHCELSLRDATIRQRVYFTEDATGPSGYFTPTQEQAAHLEVVEDRFMLPLPAGVVEILKDRRGAIFRSDQDSLDAAIREAARHVSDGLGTRITAGQIRRSFSAHLFELCRDLAMTQLICADTLGQSDAPSHYYSPRASEVTNTYSALMSTLFEIEKPPLEPRGDDTRVGARLLVCQETVREMTKSLGALLHTGVERLVDGGQAGRVHEAMVLHLGCMFMAACSHRPTNALFELDLGSIDLESRSALFQDKIHDHAHDPRLVALPVCVVRQIQAYLQHLAGLAEVIPHLANVIRKVMAGKSPLLFGLDADENHCPLSIRTFATPLPPIWKVVPMNWGRAWIRTHASDFGLSAEQASIQLGHLEAVGYPFSQGSPLEPARFATAVGPALDRLAAAQGWTVKKGLVSQSEVETSLAPLGRWSTRVRAHEAAVRESAKAWRVEQKARMNHYKRQAEDDVLTNATILQSGIAIQYLNKLGPWSPHPLTRPKAQLLRDEMFEAAGSDIALGLARAAALHRILKWLNARNGMKGEEPAQLMSLRRPLDNAFVPSMMTAVRQVRALRDAAEARSKQPPSDWRDFVLACARTIYSMTVFGFCDCPFQIRGALERRHTVVRPASLVDAILVEWGPEPNQVLGMRGLAALAVARLAKKYPTQGVPSPDEINMALAQLLPPWAHSKKGAHASEPVPDYLAMLCETVSVCNRIELSPAARMALDSKRGSVNAHILEQAALLDGDPVGTLQRSWESESEPEVGEIQLPRGKRTGNARSQYRALCAAIPSSERDLILPLTGKNIAASQLVEKSTRQAVIAELRAQLAQEAPTQLLQPIVRLLAVWALQMLEEGTAKTANPADKTVSTYLSRISGVLVEIFGRSSVFDCGDAELEDAYLDAVKSTNDSQAAAAAAILEFHDCCVRRFDFPLLDLSEVRLYLSNESRSVDAALILASERDEAVKHLLNRTEATDAGDKKNRAKTRVCRQAAVALPLYAFCGARRSEILGIQFQDIAWNADSAARIRIRANRSRRLKTLAARRYLSLGENIPDPVNLHLSEWIQADRSRLSTWRRERAYLFSPLEDGRRADGRGEVAKACSEILSQTTGRRKERLHRLRHLVAFELIAPLMLCDRDHAAISIRQAWPMDVSLELVLPRDIAEKVVNLGHAHCSTSLRCYFHSPWLLRSRADEVISAKYFARRGVAAALGLSLPAIDRVIQMAKSVPPEKAWMDHVIASRIIPNSTIESESESDKSIVSRGWTATELGQLVGVVERVGNLRRALSVMGANENEADRIRFVFLTFEKRLGRRIVGGEFVDSVDMPRRIVRDIGQGSSFEKWWELVGSSEEPEAHSLVRLAEVVFENMSPKDGDTIRVPAATSRALIDLLEKIGMPRSDIVSEELPLGFVELRVRRKRQFDPTQKGMRDESAIARADERYLGLSVKRVLGIIWAANRLSSHAP